MQETDNRTELPVETHPWPPFIPDGARVLIMGTFPPAPKRWSMDFYYPNPTNDFWRIAGMVFLGDASALYDNAGKCFRIDDVRALMAAHHIALHDTCRRIRRLQGNASDKFLEVVEAVDLASLLKRMPECHDIATTGEQAAGVVAALTGSEPPKMGEYMEAEAFGRRLRIWRMPSTSRAYPLKAERKAEYYRRLWEACGCM